MLFSLETETFLLNGCTLKSKDFNIHFLCLYLLIFFLNYVATFCLFVRWLVRFLH